MHCSERFRGFRSVFPLILLFIPAVHVSGCSGPKCGNGIVEEGEECDPGHGMEYPCVNECGVEGMGRCSEECTFLDCCAYEEVCGNGCNDNCNYLDDYVRTTEEVVLDEEISSVESLSLGSPRILFTGSEFAVLWSRGIGSGEERVDDLYFSRVAIDGSRLGDEIRVDGGEWVGGGCFAYTGTEFGVFYFKSGAEGRRVLFKTLSPDGAVVSEASVVMVEEEAVSLGGSSVVFTGSEYGIVLAGKHTYDDRFIVFKRISTEGSVLGESMVTEDDFIANPSIVFASSGFGVVWEQYPEDSDVRRTYFRSLSLSGESMSGETLVAECDDSGGGYGLGPSMAFTGSEYWIFWEPGDYSITRKLEMSALDTAGRIVRSNVYVDYYGRLQQIMATPVELGLMWYAQESYHDGTIERENLYFKTYTLDGNEKGEKLTLDSWFVNVWGKPAMAYSGSEYGIAWVYDDGESDHALLFRKVGFCED